MLRKRKKSHKLETQQEKQRLKELANKRLITNLNRVEMF